MSGVDQGLVGPIDRAVTLEFFKVLSDSISLDQAAFRLKVFFCLSSS